MVAKAPFEEGYEEAPEGYDNETSTSSEVELQGGPEVLKDVYFEEKKVDIIETKVTGASSFEAIKGWSLGIDDRVRAVFEARVTKVTHIMRDGQLVRLQEIKVSDIKPAPWDPSNPNDYGVIHA